jgi:hypothetical protein
MVSIFLSHDSLQSISSGQALGGVFRVRPILQRAPKGVQGIRRIIYSLLFFDIVVC